MKPNHQSPLRAAVIGAGVIGDYHAQKYRKLEGVDLVFVVDIMPERARGLAIQHSCNWSTSYQSLFDLNIDCVSICTPATSHFEISAELLKKNISLLIEKPLALSLFEANHLIQISRLVPAVVQVAHIERFNNVLRAVLPLLSKCRTVEFRRVAPFCHRGLDTDVVFDLMIHDIDYATNVFPGTPVNIRAKGWRILSEMTDVAEAYLEYKNGLIVKLYASRAGRIAERTLNARGEGFGFIADLRSGIVTKNEDFDGRPVSSTQCIHVGDPLQEQLGLFVAACRGKCEPYVSLEDGSRAVALAETIRGLILQEKQQLAV